MIISGQAPNPEAVEAFQQAASLAGLLQSGEDYKVSQRFREVDLTEEGKRRLAELAEPLGGIWTGARRREEMITQALTAGELYLRDKQYVVQEGKVVIVDEFTGRLMPDREWRDGLHQAVSAKEAVEVQSPKETFSRVSFQRFFRLYRKLSGMTGTAREGRREFWQIYHTPVVVIPTNRPCARTVLPDMALADEKAKWAAIVEQIEEIHRTGRPILVGTRSVRASEHLSAMLTVGGLDHSVLNAVRHAEEERGRRGGSRWPQTWPGAGRTLNWAAEWRNWADCTSWPPKGMKRVAWTASFSVDRPGRATQGPHGLSSAWRMNWSAGTSRR